MAPKLFELLEADEPDWVQILVESSDIEQARYIHPLTKLTPLHLAVMAKDTTNNQARVGAVRSLLQSDLEATRVQCEKHGYTPLMYACIATDLNNLEYDVPVVKLLLEFDADCFRVTSRAGQTALDIHIITMSRLKKSQSHSERAKPQSCTSVLKALTEQDLGISLPRSLDLLLTCNSFEVMEHLAQEEAHAFAARLRDRRKQRKEGNVLPVAVGSRNFVVFWVWDFVLTLLRAEHNHTYKDIKPVPPFNALHTASQVRDFPLSFMMMCMRAYPAQVRTPSIVQNDLPIHSVAGWEATESMVARKSMTMTQLLYEHPTGCKYRNRHGKTPLSLALETRTTWDHGVRRLSAALREDSFVKRETPGIME